MTEKPRVTDKRHSAGSARPQPEAAAPETAMPESDAETSPPSDELGAARAQAEEYLEHLQRLQAEFENYRKRTVKEQTRALDFAAEGLVRRLLDVLDDFERALGAADAKPEFAPFHRGFELVQAKLLAALRAEGLETIPAEGEPFDPEVHEALAGSGDTEGEPFVAEVLRPGYRLRERVIRPAGVRVGHRPAEGEPA
jgi:molecular chaperone GrpE